MTTIRKSAAVIALASFLVAGIAMTADAKKKSTNNSQRKRVFSEAIVTGIPPTSPPMHFNVTIKGVVYGVDATNARINRRNNKRATFSEVMVRDRLKVWGSIDSNSPGIIVATKIRDNSIYKLGSSLKGTIDTPITGIYNPNDGTTLYQFTLLTRNRGRRFVETLSTTAIKYRGRSKTFADLHQGDSIEIKGLWNKANFKIYNTSRIKITRFAAPVL